MATRTHWHKSISKTTLAPTQKHAAGGEIAASRIHSGNMDGKALMAAANVPVCLHRASDPSVYGCPCDYVGPKTTQKFHRRAITHRVHMVSGCGMLTHLCRSIGPLTLGRGRSQGPAIAIWRISEEAAQKKATCTDDDFAKSRGRNRVKHHEWGAATSQCRLHAQLGAVSHCQCQTLICRLHPCPPAANHT
jgi:hypothetical protein